MIRVVESASNELRLAEARAFIRSELGKGDLLLVAPREAAILRDPLRSKRARRSGCIASVSRNWPHA